MNSLYGIGRILIACFFAGLCAAEEKDATNRVRLLSKGIPLEFGYSSLGATVDRMPLEVRDVPVHEDDWPWRSNRGPIRQLEYDADHSVYVSLLYSREYGRGFEEPWRFKYGVGLDWMIDVGADIAERNYTFDPGTDERGYGAALTYVSVRQGGIIPSLNNTYADLFLNWTPRAQFEVAPFGGKFLHTLSFGTSVSYYNIAAQNGWDRYDSIEVRKNYTLLHVLPIRVYARLWSDEDDLFKSLKMGFVAGAQFQPVIGETQMGREARASVAPVTFFTGIAIGF